MGVSPHILLLGASIDSDNRGVNALGLGAIEVLHRSFGKRDIVLLKLSSEEGVSTERLVVNKSEMSVKTYRFSKHSFLKSLAEFYVFKLFKRKPASELSQIILSSENVFNINEGDSFSDIYGRTRIIVYFLYSFSVLASGREVTFLPQTIGPFNTFLGKILARYILKRVKKIYVRDAEAAKFLENMKIPYSSAVDMSVYMEPERVDYSISEKTTGVNVNGLLYYQSYGLVVGKFTSYKTLINRVLNALMNKGFNILLIPHTYNINAASAEDDLSAIKEIVAGREDDRLKYLSENYNARELKFLISQLDFFIGSRMHSCIAALSTSVPTVGLAYSIKFNGTFAMFGQKQSVIDISGISESDIDSVVARIVEKIERGAFIREKLRLVNQGRESLIIE